MEDIAVESPRPKVSALAIWSLVLGILSAIGFCFTGIPAIICGAIGLKKIGDSNGMLTGKGLAIAGIVCGVVLMLFSIVLASLAMPAYNQVVERAKTVKVTNELTQLYLGCRTYSVDNEGGFPPSLEALYPDYIDVKFVQSSSGEPYHYVSGNSDANAPETVLIYSDPIPTGQNLRAVCYVSGQVATISEAEFDALQLE